VLYCTVGLSDSKGRGTLFQQIVRVLVLRQPAAFLLENVPGLLQCDGGAVTSSVFSWFLCAAMAFHLNNSNKKLKTNDKIAEYLPRQARDGYIIRETVE